VGFRRFFADLTVACGNGASAYNLLSMPNLLIGAVLNSDSIAFASESW
jgi:hypothetical protein